MWMLQPEHVGYSAPRPLQQPTDESEFGDDMPAFFDLLFPGLRVINMKGDVVFHVPAAAAIARFLALERSQGLDVLCLGYHRPYSGDIQSIVNALQENGDLITLKMGRAGYDDHKVFSEVDEVMAMRAVVDRLTAVLWQNVHGQRRLWMAAAKVIGPCRVLLLAVSAPGQPATSLAKLPREILIRILRHEHGRLSNEQFAMITTHAGVRGNIIRTAALEGVPNYLLGYFNHPAFPTTADLVFKSFGPDGETFGAWLDEMGCRNVDTLFRPPERPKAPIL
jgi:hypothetical protein